MVDSATSLLITKGAAVLGSAVLSVIFATVPLVILSKIRNAYHGHGKSPMPDQYQRRLSLIQCALTCFTGGVFLGTSMLSMFPEIEVHFHCVKRLMATRQINERLSNYPWPHFTASMGFFFVFFVEEATLLSLKRKKTALKRISRTRTLSDNVIEAEVGVMLKQTSETKPKRRLDSVNCGDPHADPLVEPPFRPHPHSHVVRSIVLLLTLSFHTIVEAMPYALHQSAYAVWTLFWTTNIHQAVVAFALGTQLARTHRRHVAFIVSCICFYALCTPIGFLSGLGLAQAEQQLLTEEAIVMTLEGVSVGAFLYVTFYEVLTHELNNEHNSFLKLFCISLGCVVVAGLSFFGQRNERFGEEVH